MSSEASISKRTREVLTDRGFFVIKFNDAARSGVPDMQISGNGKTCWVEDKYLSIQFGFGGRESLPAGEVFHILPEHKVTARSFIEHDRMTQMVTMCKFEKHAYRSEYWLYIECKGKHYIAALSPRKVFESFRDNSPMTFDMVNVTTWRQNFET